MDSPTNSPKRFHVLLDLSDEEPTDHMPPNVTAASALWNAQGRALRRSTPWMPRIAPIVGPITDPSAECTETSCVSTASLPNPIIRELISKPEGLQRVSSVQFLSSSPSSPSLVRRTPTPRLPKLNLDLARSRPSTQPALEPLPPQPVSRDEAADLSFPPCPPRGCCGSPLRAARALEPHRLLSFGGV
eukprot:RCo028868